MSLIFVDVEATFGVGCPGLPQGGMTEFAAVEFKSRLTFHGVPNMKALDGSNEQYSEWHNTFVCFKEWLERFNFPLVFVSDNPAYDWQWINYHFWHELGHNPFGHSARRIGDFYAGLCGEWSNTQKWKRLRITKHTHNPINDAMGNAEAFARILGGER